MTVDVFYEGYALGKGLAARADTTEGRQGRLFVEMPQPMPVGTWLTLIVDGGEERSTRVTSVNEGVAPGVWVRPASPEPPPTEPPETERKPASEERPTRKDRRARTRRNVHGK